jgi:putative molybdopterin biosynthesis protein
MNAPAPASSARQDQFLEVVSKEEAIRRFRAAYEPRPLGVEQVPLAAALERVLAVDVRAPVDVPPFDRSVVDGFAVIATDTVGATETNPKRLRLNSTVLACGIPPDEGAAVTAGTATVIATGAALPRGADAVAMVEWTDPAGTDAVEVRKAVAAGASIAFAGSDIARGETVLRRGTRLGSREIGLLAACGVAEVSVWRRPKVGVISTGDELVAPGGSLPPAAIYDSNSAVVAATVAENGGEPLSFGVIRDDMPKLVAAVHAAVAACDMVILSGGTSKGAGDLSHRVLADFGPPGIVVHGVALKPGKPLCLAVAQGKPIAVLPGFPTSAIFTFRTFLVPVLRQMAGLPPSSDALVDATVPIRLPSEIGRTEFVMVSLARGAGGLIAFPTAKGSGAVTSFAQADGFLEVEALSDGVAPGSPVRVHLIRSTLALPDLVIIGSHCIGLDAVVGRLADLGVSARTLAVGSLGGLAAAKRGECDLAPIHLLHADSGTYNTPYLAEGMSLIPGWRRLQGFVFRKGDARFEGRSLDEAVQIALADLSCIMVNRNPGAGTRVILDRLLGSARPSGWHNQPRSHNAVAAAIAQGRADWGVTIATAARDYGLGFIPIADEHYDFVVAPGRSDAPSVRLLAATLADRDMRAILSEMGFAPA